ncbi:MAG: protein kinase [Chloroflexi bacterium]|nr:protein kinase [Chloroflexota bacterium]
MTTLTTVNNRYRFLEKIGQGGMGAVYKVHDRLTGENIALKQVNITPNELDFASKPRSDDMNLLRTSLAREFQILAGLRHPYIVSVLDYGFDENRIPYYTMEYIDEAQTITEFAGSVSLEQQVDLLIHTLEALAYLHRRGVIHQDIKPDNILVTTDGIVQVTDFGIARGDRTQSSSSNKDSVTFSGTFAYLAPEIYRNEEASVASDLYAVGVIAYQIFVGQMPYPTTNVGVTITSILSQTPDTSMLDNPRLAAWLNRLLLKQSDDRYPDAHSVLVALCEAMDYPVPPESQQIRESYLQASTFVGRDVELAQLTNALETGDTQNAFFLIGGESGVGKSRLLDELRIRALVKGPTVLNGQAVSSGGQPFHLWFDSLRRVALEVNLSELQMGVLKTLLPDLEDLLEHPIPALPTLTEAQAAQERTLHELTGILSALPGTTVLFLEDLHWADNASLLLLERVSDINGLVIGTYRHDEAPHLSVRFSQAQQMRLERLTLDQCQALCTAMLGEVGRERRIVDFIHKETEGNVFFIVEVVRALAEQVGQLAEISGDSLPETVLTQGIRQTVERRLDSLPVELHKLLVTAAIIGRQFDTVVLRYLHAGPVETWLSQGAELSVVEPFEGGWRFAHDKLREFLLGTLSESQKTQWHERVALGIEHVYGEDQLYAGVLAYHWRTARKRAKAQRYELTAGRMAFEQGAMREALTYLQNIQPDDLNRAERIEIHRMLAEAHYGLGNYVTAREQAVQGLGAFNSTLLPPSRGLMWATLRQWLLHTGQQLGRIKIVPAQPVHSDVARLFSTLGAITIQEANTTLFLHTTLASLNWSEQTQTLGSILLGYAGLTLMLARLGVLRRYYSRKIETSLPLLTDEGAQEDILQVYAITHLQIGDWPNAAEWLRVGVAVAARTGNQRRLEEYYTLVAYQNMIMGQYEMAWDFASQAIQSSQKRHDKSIILDSLTLQMGILQRQNKVADAVSLMREHETILTEAPNTPSITWSAGVFAQTLFQAGEVGAALTWVEVSIGTMSGQSASLIWVIEGAVGNAEVLVSLLEREDSVQRQHLLNLWQENFRYMRSFALTSPLADIYIQLIEGKLAAFEGRKRRAIRAWRKAHALATRYQMQYEQEVLASLLEKSNPVASANSLDARERGTEAGE